MSVVYTIYIPFNFWASRLPPQSTTHIWLARAGCALRSDAQGYTVRAVVRDRSKPGKVDHILAINGLGLPGSVSPGR